MTFEEARRRTVQQHWSKRLASQGPLVKGETLELIKKKYHLKEKTDMMEKPAQSATPQSNISEDVTNATTVDGQSASDICITPSMICEGLWKGDVRVEVNENDELICRIGSYYFKFDIFWHDQYPNLAMYLVHTSMDELLTNIQDALYDLKGSDEYEYYYWYLTERLKENEE